MVRDKSISSRVLDVFIYFVIAFVVLVTLIPILHVISVSLSSVNSVNRGDVSLFPREATLRSYQVVWEAGTVPSAFLNSVYYTTLGTLTNLIFTTMMAYALSRKSLPLRTFFNIIVLITMFFGGGLIPTYLLVVKLGLNDSVWAIVVPRAIATYNLIIMRTFFMSLPVELNESAKLDGANDGQIFIRIIIPLSKASIATIGLFYAVSNWNAWFEAMIYLKSSSDFPLQLILREILLQAQLTAELDIAQDDVLANRVNEESIKYATLVISIIPMLVIYPFIQKYFVKGVMLGSLKG